jgi:MoxR-like ATPase
VTIRNIRPPARPELVPSNFSFFDSPAHSFVLERMLGDWVAGHHMLLIGSQGVGKNKITDRMLQLLQVGGGAGRFLVGCGD